MLKSILFLLVLISFITTPTRAYEAYSISSLNLTEEQEAAEAAAAEPEVYELCEIAADKAEKEYNIKTNLLQTIASVESGRWNAKAGRRVAWPWTVHANGKGRYYKTKAEAVAAVQALQDRGIRNIDVGCMQVNLKYHGKAFSSLDEAFEPEKNAAYSAQFCVSSISATSKTGPRPPCITIRATCARGRTTRTVWKSIMPSMSARTARVRNCFSAAQPQSCFRTARLGENFKGGHQNAQLFRCCV